MIREATKKIVLEKELLHMLNTALSKYDECKNCHFQNIVYNLAEPDVSGCNWRNATLRCSGGTSEWCRQVAKKSVSDARKQMNIM